MRTPIPISIDPDDLEKLDKHVAKGNARGTIIEQAVEKIASNPEALGKLVVGMASAPDTPSAPTSEKKKMKNTTILMEIPVAEAVDRLASKLSSTRNALIQLIIKGLLAGLVH